MKKWTKKAAIFTTAALTAGMLLPTAGASATEDATAIELSPYLQTVAGKPDAAGTLTVSVEGEDAVRVLIRKETLDGSILYYNTLLEETGYYDFTLDRCEYNIETGEYDSSFTITVLVDGDTSCAYTLTDQLVADTGFQPEVKSTQYNWNVTTVATATRQVTAVATSTTTAEGIVSSTTDVTLEYIPYLLGDVNADNQINADDAYLVLVYYAKASVGDTPSFTENGSLQEENIAFSAADVTKDNEIDADDAYEILRYYAQSSVGDEPSWNNLY